MTEQESGIEHSVPQTDIEGLSKVLRDNLDVLDEREKKAVDAAILNGHDHAYGVPSDNEDNGDGGEEDDGEDVPPDNDSSLSSRINWADERKLSSFPALQHLCRDAPDLTVSIQALISNFSKSNKIGFKETAAIVLNALLTAGDDDDGVDNNSTSLVVQGPRTVTAWNSWQQLSRSNPAYEGLGKAERAERVKEDYLLEKKKAGKRSWAKELQWKLDAQSFAKDESELKTKTISLRSARLQLKKVGKAIVDTTDKIPAQYGIHVMALTFIATPSAKFTQQDARIVVSSNTLRDILLRHPSLPVPSLLGALQKESQAEWIRKVDLVALAEATQVMMSALRDPSRCSFNEAVQMMRRITGHDDLKFTHQLMSLNDRANRKGIASASSHAADTALVTKPKHQARIEAVPPHSDAPHHPKRSKPRTRALSISSTEPLSPSRTEAARDAESSQQPSTNAEVTKGKSRQHPRRNAVSGEDMDVDMPDHVTQDVSPARNTRSSSSKPLTDEMSVASGDDAGSPPTSRRTRSQSRAPTVSLESEEEQSTPRTAKTKSLLPTKRTRESRNATVTDNEQDENNDPKRVRWTSSLPDRSDGRSRDTSTPGTSGILRQPSQTVDVTKDFPFTTLKYGPLAPPDTVTYAIAKGWSNPQRIEAVTISSTKGANAALWNYSSSQALMDQISRRKHSRDLQAFYISELPSPSPLTIRNLPHTDVDIPAGQSNPPPLVLGRDGTTKKVTAPTEIRHVAWVHTIPKNVKEPKQLFRKSLEVGVNILIPDSERRNGSNGELKPYGFTNLPSYAEKQKMAILGLPGFTTPWKYWIGVANQDMYSIIATRDGILSFDEQDALILVGRHHFAEQNLPMPGFANYLPSGTSIVHYDGFCGGVQGSIDKLTARNAGTCQCCLCRPTEKAKARSLAIKHLIDNDLITVIAYEDVLYVWEHPEEFGDPDVVKNDPFLQHSMAAADRIQCDPERAGNSAVFVKNWWKKYPQGPEKARRMLGLDDGGNNNDKSGKPSGSRAHGDKSKSKRTPRTTSQQSPTPARQNMENKTIQNALSEDDDDDDASFDADSTASDENDNEVDADEVNDLKKDNRTHRSSLDGKQQPRRPPAQHQPTTIPHNEFRDAVTPDPPSAQDRPTRPQPRVEINITGATPKKPRVNLRVRGTATNSDDEQDEQQIRSSLKINTFVANKLNPFDRQQRSASSTDEDLPRLDLARIRSSHRVASGSATPATRDDALSPGVRGTTPISSLAGTHDWRDKWLSLTTVYIRTSQESTVPFKAIGSVIAKKALLSSDDIVRRLESKVSVMAYVQSDEKKFHAAVGHPHRKLAQHLLLHGLSHHLSSAMVDGKSNYLGLSSINLLINSFFEIPDSTQVRREKAGDQEPGLDHIHELETAHLEDLQGWHRCYTTGILPLLQLSVLEYILGAVPDTPLTPAIHRQRTAVSNVSQLAAHINSFRQAVYMDGEVVSASTAEAAWALQSAFASRLLEVHQALSRAGTALRLEVIGWVIAHLFALDSSGFKDYRQDSTLSVIGMDELPPLLRMDPDWGMPGSQYKSNNNADARIPFLIDGLEPDKWLVRALGWYAICKAQDDGDSEVPEDWRLFGLEDDTQHASEYFKCLQAFRSFRQFDDYNYDAPTKTGAKSVIVQRLTPLYHIVQNNMPENARWGAPSDLLFFQVRDRYRAFMTEALALAQLEVFQSGGLGSPGRAIAERYLEFWSYAEQRMREVLDIWKNKDPQSIFF